MEKLGNQSALRLSTTSESADSNTARTCRAEPFKEPGGLSTCSGSCYDEFGREVSRGFLLAVYGRFGQEYEQSWSFRANSARYATCAKPHKHWLFRISLIWRVGT
jgi:hypothetical protein